MARRPFSDGSCGDEQLVRQLPALLRQHRPDLMEGKKLNRSPPGFTSWSGHWAKAQQPEHTDFRPTHRDWDADGVRGTPTAEAVAAYLEFTSGQRAPDRWSTIATTDFLARSFTWQWPGVAAARGLGLSLLQALPPLKRVLARQMMYGRR
jgi:hypothetical protein